MNNTVVFYLFGAERFSAFGKSLGFIEGNIEFLQFPDEETLVTLHTPVNNQEVILIASMEQPNAKILPLIFAAETARALGAKKIHLIAPYWVYMRQDHPFHAGEGISSQYLAKLISIYFDSFMTIEPHLHRWHSLSQIFTIPATTLHIPNTLAKWIAKNIERPVLIGPDEESEQWVQAIATRINAPHLIVKKTRFSATEVEATVPQIKQYPDHTPVIVDDIISTAGTLIETVKHLKALGLSAIYCVGVHAIFAREAYSNLLATEITQVATCNTIAHPSNLIDVTADLMAAWKVQSFQPDKGQA